MIEGRPNGTPADEYMFPLYPDKVGRSAAMGEASVGKTSTCFSVGQA